MHGLNPIVSVFKVVLTLIVCELPKGAWSEAELPDEPYVG